MKTIVENQTNISKYLLEDNVFVSIASDSITVGDPTQFIIDDMDNNNATLHIDITNAPEDWAGCKYTFDGSIWATNLDWADPEAEE